MPIELDLSGLFELFPLEVPGKSKKAAPTDPFARKSKWEQLQTKFSGLELWLLDWELLFDEFGLNWSFGFTFNFLLDLILTLDFHLEFDLSFDFKFEFDEFIFEEFGYHIDDIVKAKYDITSFGMSYFDPPEITGNDLRKFTWWLRRFTTDKKYFTYRYRSKAAKTITETNKNLVYQQMVREWLLDGFESAIAIVEAKVIRAAYVGFAIVGVSHVPAKAELASRGYGKIYARDPRDWKTIVELESNGIYESHVGFARVYYARVSPSKDRYAKVSGDVNRRMFSKETADRLKRNVEEGRKELGIRTIETPYGSLPYMPARMNAYLATEDKKWKGGVHQALMHHNAQVVKQILDKHGVVGFFRKPYHDFAMELAYRKYNTRNKTKVWKRIFSGDEELIEKYKSYGCDETILREIANKIWRADTCLRERIG